MIIEQSVSLLPWITICSPPLESGTFIVEGALFRNEEVSSDMAIPITVPSKTSDYTDDV